MKVDVPRLVWDPNYTYTAGEGEEAKEYRGAYYIPGEVDDNGLRPRAEAIDLAKLYNKVTLYTLAAPADYAYVRPLYPEVKVWRTSIELKHKLLLTMASFGLDSLVYRIIHLFR